jgi:hypothetical protein
MLGVGERRKVMLKRYGGYVWQCAGMLVLLVLLAGCVGADNQAILNLVPLQVQLATEYGATNIVVILEDGNTLGVTVAGDSFRSAASALRAARAREIADFVCRNYAAVDRIEKVRVIFEIGQGGGLVDATASATFSFARSELACRGR